MSCERFNHHHVKGLPFTVPTIDIKTTSCCDPHPIQGVVVFHLKPSVVVVVKSPETVRASQAWLAPPPLHCRRRPPSDGVRFFCRAQRVLLFLCLIILVVLPIVFQKQLI